MRWSVRLRDRNLALLDDVKFSSLTLVETYNAPSTLVITGRLDHIRTLLRPGYGVVVGNSDGQKFCGRLSAARRNGDGTGSASYTGDLKSLWDRICYPNTNLAWDSQISNRDIVTGAAEDRIISLVNRNAGPAAWHSAITGTDPGESTTFTEWKVIVPDTRNEIVQDVVVDPVNGDIYMNQIAADKKLHIRRLDTNGILQSTMTLPKGTHGDVMFLSFTGTGTKRKVYLTLKYGSPALSADKTGTWVRLPYTAAKTWTASAALALKTATPAGWASLDRRTWCQGEAMYDGYTFRLYGTPYNNTGPTSDNPAMPAFIEVIQNNKILRTVPAGHLGRDANNNPYDGRLEPEGLSIVTVNGQPNLLVGICTGTTTGGGVGADGKDGGLIAHHLYTLPIRPAARAAEDRRVKFLRMPAASLVRGPGGTTTARSDQLGPLVAGLAESADLSLRVTQEYETAGPYLQFRIDSTPDLSETIRVTSGGSGGPVELGADWTYTAATPNVTTGLALAGGEGSDRILRYQRDTIAEDVWDIRVETLIDQNGLTDLSEIDDGILKALLDAVGPSEISAPLGRTTLPWGTAIPLGAKIAAVLDGQAAVERVRQITTTVANTSGSATTTVSAVLGSPETALKTPQARQVASMLARLRALERRGGTTAVDGGTF